MKKLIITILACTFVFSLNAQTTVSGPHVSGIWTAFESPYMIHGNITVHTDSLLSIEPNVQIIFQDEYLFTINGNLQAIGLNGDSIRFTVQDTTGFYNNTHTGWNGLYFYNSTSSSKLDFCIIEYSKSHGIFGEHSTFEIVSSAVRFNNQNGITILDSRLDLDNSTIKENNGNGIHLDYDAVLISNNTKTNNNNGNGLYIANSVNITLTNFTTTFNNGAGVLATTFSSFSFNGGTASHNLGRGINIDVYSSNITLNDLTIQENYGGGVYCNASSTIHGSNLLIDSNTASNGAGLYCLYNSSLTLDSSIISNNDAGFNTGSGGGIYVSGGTISLTNSQIINCVAKDGGGIQASNSQLFITNSNIIDSYCRDYGGGINASETYINVSNLIITNCSSVEFGGGLSIGNSQYCNFNNLTINNCSSIEGGGLYVSGSTINIDSSEISNNDAAAWGGAINSVGSTIEIQHSLFNGNSASNGGCFYFAYGTINNLLIEKTTFVNNNADAIGSIIFCDSGIAETIIKNSIIWDNTESWFAGETDITVSYSNLQSADFGPTNISSDPLFVNPLNDDFHLSWAGFPLNNATKSPCIDSGDPTSPLDPDGTQIDMGAFSFDHYQYSASISSILDVPNDQGKRLVINWNRSHLDNIDSMKITHYKIWRLQNWAETPWEYIGETPAHYFDEYSFIATTINDSTANGIPYYTYLISSETENPFIFYNSLPDSGYSVDNIAPEPPDEVYGYQENNSVQLFWNPSIDEDFDYFSIYRNLNSKNLEFEIIATVTDTFFIDQNISGDTLYYNITATDLNDNESEHSDIYQITNSRTLDLKLFLEGPFFVSQMISYLNLGGHLPLSQPYNNNPWNYDGMETVEQIPNNEIIDWILLEFRDAADSLSANEATSIYKTAAFVKEDGTIVDLDGVNQLKVALSFENNLYLMIWHRNHLPTMSSFPLNDVDGHFTYNFSNSANKIFGGANYHKQLSPGIWGFMAADGNADGQIDNKDKNNIWIYEFYNIGYKSGDFNMDGQVNFEDKLLWGINAGRGCLTTD